MLLSGGKQFCFVIWVFFPKKPDGLTIQTIRANMVIIVFAFLFSFTFPRSEANVKHLSHPLVLG